MQRNYNYFHFTTQAADQNNYRFCDPPCSSHPAFFVTLCPARRDPPYSSRPALFVAPCPARRVLPCSSHQHALLIMPRPARRAPPSRPAWLVAQRPARQATPCCARAPCSSRHAAPCSSRHAAPCSSRHAAPCSSRHAAPCSSRHAAPCSSRHAAPCSSRHPASCWLRHPASCWLRLRPGRRACVLLVAPAPCSSRLALLVAPRPRCSSHHARLVTPHPAHRPARRLPVAPCKQTKQNKIQTRRPQKLWRILPLVVSRRRAPRKWASVVAPSATAAAAERAVAQHPAGHAPCGYPAHHVCALLDTPTPCSSRYALPFAHVLLVVSAPCSPPCSSRPARCWSMTCAMLITPLCCSSCLHPACRALRSGRRALRPARLATSC